MGGVADKNAKHLLYDGSFALVVSAKGLVIFMRTALIIGIIVLAFAATWFGSNALIEQRDYTAHSGEVERAITLAERRVPQAQDVFEDFRGYLNVLADSEEFFSRNMSIVSLGLLPGDPMVMISERDEEVFWSYQWHDELPWLEMQHIEAIVALLRTEIEGSRYVSIVFSEDTLTYIVFGTPLHVDPPRAWVALHYGGDHVWPDRQVVHTEALADGWSIVLTSEIPRNGAGLFIVITAVIAVLIIAAVVVLVWGIKTYKFSSSGEYILYIALIVTVLIIILIGSWIFMGTLGAETAGGAW